MTLFSAVSKEGTIAPRTGFFHNFKKKETMIRRWHAVEEDMKDSGIFFLKHPI